MVVEFSFLMMKSSILCYLLKETNGYVEDTRINSEKPTICCCWKKPFIYPSTVVIYLSWPITVLWSVSLCKINCLLVKQASILVFKQVKYDYKNEEIGVSKQL